MIANILKNPKLLPMILDEAHKVIVREDDTMLALININWIRLVKNAQPTSSNVVLNSYTRAGKDYIAKNLYRIIMPSDLYIHRSKISKEAFTYWHHDDQQNWTWDGKQIHLEDVTTGVLNSPVFKTLSSGSNIATVVVKNTAVDFDVPGKPNITVTGFNIDLNLEALGRFAIIHLDESKGQTKAIKDFRSKLEAGKIDTTPDNKLREVVQSLEPVDVIIPFAEKLDTLFPDTILMRDI